MVKLSVLKAKKQFHNRSVNELFRSSEFHMGLDCLIYPAAKRIAVFVKTAILFAY